MNPFSSYGQGRGRGRPRRPSTAASAQIARHQEQLALATAYQAMRCRWFEEVLAGPEGPRVRALIAWVATLGPDDADELVDVVAGEDWLLAAAPDVRFAALALIDDEICRIRRQAGLPDLDDPLPDEPDTAFLIIRRLLSP